MSEFSKWRSEVRTKLTSLIESHHLANKERITSDYGLITEIGNVAKLNGLGKTVVEKLAEDTFKNKYRRPLDGESWDIVQGISIVSIDLI